MPVYRVIEVIGTSTQSWEDAAKNAVETAGRMLRDLRVAEVVKTEITVKDGKVECGLAYHRTWNSVRFASTPPTGAWASQ